jgi:AcrR family transcriptional regulator
LLRCRARSIKQKSGDIWCARRDPECFAQVSVRKRLSPEESRITALEAARGLLIEAGPQAVTLKAVAGRIGRTHANLLHHFGSASGLQRDLARHLAETVCATIREAVIASRSGIGCPRDVVDLTFDAFDKEGAGALASWMIVSGNEDALDPIVDAVHDLVIDLNEFGSGTQRTTTLALTLMALGDALLGGPLSVALELPREAARGRAEQMLIEGLLQVGITPVEPQ